MLGTKKRLIVEKEANLNMGETVMKKETHDSRIGSCAYRGDTCRSG